MKGAVTVFSPWVTLERDVAQGETEAGGMLLRAIVALGLGTILLSVAAQIALPLWHHYVLRSASEQADQRAASVIFELSSALATAERLPDAMQWSQGHDDGHPLTVMSSATGFADSYRWDSVGTVAVQRIGRRGSERLADGITTVIWQPDLSFQGGWLRIEAVSDPLSFEAPSAYRIGCRAEASQACRTLMRYVAHPSLPPAVSDGETS